MNAQIAHVTLWGDAGGKGSPANGTSATMSELMSGSRERTGGPEPETCVDPAVYNLPPRGAATRFPSPGAPAVIHHTCSARRAAIAVGLCVVSGIAAARPAFAAPANLAAVPADAVWMMHLDMDAARESTVVRRTYERAMAMHPHAEGMIAMVKGMTGMDPRKDPHDVTVYGRDTDKRNAVMVVRAKANREFLEKMVEKARDHRTMEHAGRTLHSWTQRGRKGGTGETVVGAFQADDRMVFARSADAVKMALDVLDGSKAAYAAGPLAGGVKPGSILVARAAAIDPDTKCPVLRQGRGYRVAAGEDGGRSFYRAKLDMKSAAAAGLTEDVVEGFEAVVKLRWEGDDVAMKLLSGLRTETSGDVCTIAWDASADDVWKAMEKAVTQWERKHRRSGDGGRACAACGTDGCEGCGGCPFQGEGDSKKEGRPQVEEF